MRRATERRCRCERFMRLSAAHDLPGGQSAESGGDDEPEGWNRMAGGTRGGFREPERHWRCQRARGGDDMRAASVGDAEPVRRQGRRGRKPRRPAKVAVCCDLAKEPQPTPDREVKGKGAGHQCDAVHEEHTSWRKRRERRRARLRGRDPTSWSAPGSCPPFREERMESVVGNCVHRRTWRSSFHTVRLRAVTHQTHLGKLC